MRTVAKTRLIFASGALALIVAATVLWCARHSLVERWHISRLNGPGRYDAAEYLASRGCVAGVPGIVAAIKADPGEHEEWWGGQLWGEVGFRLYVFTDLAFALYDLGVRGGEPARKAIDEALKGWDSERLSRIAAGLYWAWKYTESQSAKVERFTLPDGSIRKAVRVQRPEH